MAIVINGSGTVTGISVGGLPDGIVDAGTVAADVATQAELDAAAISLSGSTDNTITTVTGSNAIQGEANLTFDGNNLEVTGSSGVTFVADNSSTNNLVARLDHNTDGNAYGMAIDFTLTSPDDNGQYFLHCIDSTAVRCEIKSDGDLQNHDNSYGSLSDERIKQDIQDSGSQWDDIKNIRVRKFKKKDDVAQYGDNAWEQLGVIAQEVELVSPKLIEHSPPDDFTMEYCDMGTQNEEGEWIPNKDENGEDVTVKSMKYSILYIKAVKALQEAMTRIEILETKVETLENA